MLKHSVVTDEKGFLTNIFDFKHLKFKEKDDLDFIFKFWGDKSRLFDIGRMWYVASA